MKNGGFADAALAMKNDHIVHRRSQSFIHKTEHILATKKGIRLSGWRASKIRIGYSWHAKSLHHCSFEHFKGYFKFLKCIYGEQNNQMHLTQIFNWSMPLSMEDLFEEAIEGFNGWRAKLVKVWFYSLSFLFTQWQFITYLKILPL
jgi:hypothetical protein